MPGPSRNVELGTVGFNLEANDSSLDASLAKLRKFGEGVNKASNVTDEAGKKAYTSMVKVEKVLTTTFDKVSALTENLKKLGAADEAIVKLTTEYGRMVDAAIKASRAFEPHEQVRAAVGLAAATAQATRQLKDQASTTSLLEAKQNALVSTWERANNAMSRMRLRGVGEQDLAKYNTVLEKFQQEVEVSDLSTQGLAAAQRAFNLALGETNRELRANIAEASMAERQQSRLIQATRNVAYVNARLTRSNLPSDLVNANQSALQGFGAALQTNNSAQVLAAQQKLNDALMASRLAMAGAEKPVNKLSLAMHDFSKATVLALGPLSGVGSRIAVMTALLDSNSVKVALFIGGMVTAGSALYSLTSAAIKASMEQEKFDALLNTSTGSATLAGKEYQYLLDTSNRLGQRVQGLVKPYADFSAAARLSGITLEQQRKIFESIITTGSALRWNEEQVGRAFLAVTQMISKGTVMSEEMKKQLGELIPNVIGLGAAAEKTSTQGFMKMMQDGKVLTSEFLPKLAEQLDKVFSSGAAQGAQSLQGRLAALQNSAFEFLKEFNRVSGVSEVFRRAVLGATDAIDYLTKNMTSVVAVFAAFAAGGAAYAGVLLLSRLPVIFTAVATGVRALTIEIGAARLALIALESTTVIGWVARLAAVVVSAAMGWKLFKDNAEAAANVGSNINDKISDWIKSQEKIGTVQQQVRDQMAAQAGERLGVLQKQLDQELEFQAKMEKAKNPKPGTPAYDRRQIAINNGEDPDADLRKARERVAATRAQMEELTGLVRQMASIKLEPPQPIGPKEEELKSWESWLKRISKHISDAQSKAKEFDALVSGGEDAQRFQQALGKAQDIMIEMPKKAGNLKVVADMLRQAGFEGEDVLHQLQAMFLAEEKAADGIRDFGKAAREQKEGVKELSKMFDELENRRVAISGEVTGFDPSKAKAAKQLQDDLDKLREALKKTGMAEEGMTAVLGVYEEQWRKITEAEDHQKQVERVTKALEQMSIKIGDPLAKLTAQRDKEIALIEEAKKLKILSEEEAAAAIIKINDDMYRKLVDKTSEFHDFLNKMTSSIESGLADAFAGKGDIYTKFKDLLNKIWGEIVAFMVRVAIIKPMLTALFGGTYSGNQGDGQGLLGGLLTNLGKVFIGNGFQSSSGGGVIDYSQVNPDTNPGFGRANGGWINPFETRWVGEREPELLTMGKDGGMVYNSSQLRNMSLGGGGVTVQDNSRNVYNIDARSDAGSIMQTVNRANAARDQRLQRELKVRYG